LSRSSFTSNPGWSETRIVQTLAELFRRGVVITRNGLIEGGQAELVPVVEQLGGFPRLRRLARLPRQCERRQGPLLDARAVKAAIRRRRRSGAPLTGPRVPNRLRADANRLFGSWRDAIEAAGYDYVEISRWRKYSDQDLLELVRGLARAHPAMTYGELRRHPRSETLRVRFGSLRAALCCAGLPAWAPRK
jgi:hypothetical protein